jgi:ABC-type dipeptide/oligopeptide/nickel transport system ATPase subunit
VIYRYFDKKMKANDLLAAIRRAARGEILFDKEQMKQARQWRDKIQFMSQDLFTALEPGGACGFRPHFSGTESGLG